MTQTGAVSIPIPLIAALRSANKITILTGAGISAESGIPTFRDSQTGLWAQYDPHQLATPEAFQQDPRLVFNWYRWRRSLAAQAAPNPGHLALAKMEQHIPGLTLITQNVDGLHHRAGSQNIIELHGSLQRLRCSNLACDYPSSDWIDDAELPVCPRCGTLLRPDIVWFGEAMPQSQLATATQASRDCEIFFSVGTSGVVEPAASLPYEALRSKAIVVEINPMPTPLSVYTHYSIVSPAGVVLPQLVAAAWER